ncbi:Hypothetical protein, putative, partial [Bodo saltans]
FVFTLNMFVLGCSTMGEEPRLSLGTMAASSKPPPAPSSTVSSAAPNTPMPLLSGQTPMSAKAV